jgi:hypothetical protein
MRPRFDTERPAAFFAPPFLTIARYPLHEGRLASGSG